jgi:hypothetical protein
MAGPDIHARAVDPVQYDGASPPYERLRFRRV